MAQQIDSKRWGVEIDWMRIEELWRAGVPTRQISKQTGISQINISLKARNMGWIRDSDAMVQAAETKKRMFRRAFAESTGLDEGDVRDLIDDAKDLEDADLQGVMVQLHRKNIGKFRGLAEKLFDELNNTTVGKDIYGEVAKLLAAEDKDGNALDGEAVEKFNKLMGKVASLGNRIDSLKKLAETTKIIVAIERESFGLKPIDYDDSAKKAARDAAQVVTEGFDLIQNKFREVLEANVVKDITPEDIKDNRVRDED